MDSNVAEVTMDTSGVMPHCLKRHGSEVIDDYGFCEVAHMTKAYAQGALHRGATAVTVVPYPGWDSIWPFLNAGVKGVCLQAVSHLCHPVSACVS